MTTQVEVPDRKSICPDRPRRKVSVSRPSQTESAYVQTFVRSKVFLRSSCVQKSSCPDFRAFKSAYVQTFVHSKEKFARSKIDNLCVHVQTIVRSCPDYHAFKIAYVQTIVRSKLHMSRLSCVHFFPDRVILNARRHLVRSIRSGHIDYRSGTSPQPGYNADKNIEIESKRRLNLRQHHQILLH